MIIGCALVVDELNKGPRLVLRYPESLPSSFLNFNNKSLLKFHYEYLNISPENFAKLFRPKQPLCNKVIELCIDDLQYISYACSCGSDNNNRTSNSNYTASTVTLFNIVIVKVRDNVMKKSLFSHIYTSTSSKSSSFNKNNTNRNNNSSNNYMSDGNYQDQLNLLLGIDPSIHIVATEDIKM